MEQTATISVKIPRAWRERMKRSRIRVSTVVRSALERAILEEEARRLNEDSRRHKRVFDKLSVEDVVRDIREDRDSG